MTDELDMISFRMIADAGDARMFAFQALDAAGKGEMKNAQSLLEQAKESLQKARRAQTDLLFDDLNGQKKNAGLLMIHSQDHLMDAALALQLIEQMIPMQTEIETLNRRIEELERG